MRCLGKTAADMDFIFSMPAAVSLLGSVKYLFLKKHRIHHLQNGFESTIPVQDCIFFKYPEFALGSSHRFSLGIRYRGDLTQNTSTIAAIAASARNDAADLAAASG
jgi:hypothetical protein